MTDLATRIEHVKAQMLEAETAAGRRGEVKLLAVSKTRPDADIEAAYKLGLRAFGENYVQEGVDKTINLSQQGPLKDIEWHFIGPIQSNKSRLVSEHFHWVHTIDRLKIAQRLNEQRPPQLEPLNVLIQVNISEQVSKSGVSLQEVEQLAAEISDMPNLKLRGLMCIPAPAETEQDNQRLTNEFNAMSNMLTQLAETYSSADTLSMGMSGDLEQAIQSGSTMVRIGTAIFGPRDYSKKS